MHNSDGPGTLTNETMVSRETQRLELLLQDGISKIYQDSHAEPRMAMIQVGAGGWGAGSQIDLYSDLHGTRQTVLKCKKKRIKRVISEEAQLPRLFPTGGRVG